MNSRDNFMYFLVGAGFGAALGVLYAPKSGADTRAFLQSKAEEGSDYVQDAVTSTAQSARETVDRAKKAAAAGLERGKKAVKEFKDSETLTAAVEAGRQAYRDAQEGGFEN